MDHSGVVSERNDRFALRLDLGVLRLLFFVTDATSLGSLGSFLLRRSLCRARLSRLGLQSLEVQLLNGLKLLIVLSLAGRL